MFVWVLVVPVTIGAREALQKPWNWETLFHLWKDEVTSMRLEPNDLLLFARVIEDGSFSRTAQHLEIPVSTVSRRISALEAQLGERLFLRTTRKLTVTDLGHALLEHARQIADGAQSAEALADNRQLTPGGRLRISIPSGMVFLAPFLAEFLASYPAITLEADASMRVVDLIGENFDLALRLGKLGDDATLAARHIADLRGGLFASPRYLGNRGVPKTPEDLAAHDALHALTRSGEALPWRLRRGTEQWEGTPSGRALLHSPELLLELAMHGAGIAIGEERGARPYVEAGRLVRVLPDWNLTSPLWAVFPGRKLMPVRTRVFLDALIAKISDDSAQRASARKSGPGVGAKRTSERTIRR